MKKRSNLLIGMIAVAVIIAGIVMMPRTATAAESVIEGENGIIFVQDSENLDIQDYWAEGKAPVRIGYVFAGWYSDSNEESALSETEAADGATAIRVLSSVDTDVYQKVGFDIYLANKHQLKMEDGTAPLVTEKAFENIMVGTTKTSATTTFGAAAKYFVVWKLTDIADINDSKIIYVRPYWITCDGTKVDGLAKYVHVEDGYLGYINVPINLMTGEEIAAGVVKMTYSDLEFVGFEAGRVLPVMLDSHATEGVVKMVGNAEKIDINANADGIYANLRFKKPETLPTEEAFTTTESDFSDWIEEDVTITPIIQY